ncbi:MAG: hypothetical protein VYC34_01510 [Planctomycetota bacterium]|nr:hypothetical protein [Planctomycetota bacterium]
MLHMLAMTLAWRPFLTPLNLQDGTWWLLLAPLAFGVSMVYKAVRVPNMDRYWREVLLMTGQIIGAMILMGIAIHVIVLWLVPLLGG